MVKSKRQHGQGAIFLRLFLDDVLGMPVNGEEESNHAVVTTEYLIDREWRIDIVIELGQWFIPIEVKIYAGEHRRIPIGTIKVICRRDVVVATGSALCHGLIA